MADPRPLPGKLPAPTHVDIGEARYEYVPSGEAGAEYLPMKLMSGCSHSKHVIKDGELFMVTTTDGQIPDGCSCGLGLYYRDTRFLSRLTISLNDARPVLLSLSADKNYLSMIELCNPHLSGGDGEPPIPQETIYLHSQRLASDRIHEKLRVFNFNGFGVTIRITYDFGADFADIFEVRGVVEQRRGRHLYPKHEDNRLRLTYQGDDRIFRQTVIDFATPPSRWLSATKVVFDLAIAAKGEATIDFTIQPHLISGTDALPQKQLWVADEALAGQGHDYGVSYKAMKQRQASWMARCTTFHSNDRFFNQWLTRNQMDLGTMVVDTAGGPLITAGIPWYTVPFGRDSLITCLQTMIVQPAITQGTLRFLARWQGEEVNDWRDEEPGKILHEVRQGQLANLGQVPHTPYYGTVDATPLFVVLLAEYERWTGDTALIDELWDAMERALTWIDRFGDLDGDGYVEYLCRSPKGLVVQGWKDSYDSVMHLDGRLATGPIALVEVQGYVYHAKRAAARLYRSRGMRAVADRLETEAQDLKARFNRDFYLDDANFFAMALDGDKQLVRTIASNPGHGLWSGIIADEHAVAAAQWLLAPDMFSGWGIRTVSNEMKAFNPMSYHNGTIWPHDNAIIAKGLADYGFKKEASQILEALYEASWHFPYYRLPELFCGFTRGGELDVPVRYPVACSPQAWAAGGAFMMLQAVLGIDADAANGILHIHEPLLPANLEYLDVRRLRVGQSVIDLRFTRRADVTGCEVLRKEGPLRVMIEV